MTSARDILLGAVGEEELARHVKTLARRGGWCGAHVRYSQGVIEGVHTLRHDGHSDAHGLPDWRFWNPELQIGFDAELKGATGRVSGDQQRVCDCWSAIRWWSGPFIWRPTDEDEIRSTFLGPGH